MAFRWSKLVCNLTRPGRANRCFFELRNGLDNWPSTSRRVGTTVGTKAVSRKWNPFTWYNEMLEKYPIRTKCITSGGKGLLRSCHCQGCHARLLQALCDNPKNDCTQMTKCGESKEVCYQPQTMLYAVGDYIAQKSVASQNNAIDDQRMLRATIYASIIMAPLTHVHFNFLEWLVVKKIAARASLAPFVKTFFDQFGYWAPLITVIYHVSMGAMEGLSYNDTVDRLKTLYWPTLKACWMLWPAVMVVNFKLIPVAHQLNFCLVFSLVWATILSVIRSPTPSEAEEIEPADAVSIVSYPVEAAQR